MEPFLQTAGRKGAGAPAHRQGEMESPTDGWRGCAWPGLQTRPFANRREWFFPMAQQTLPVSPLVDKHPSLPDHADQPLDIACFDNEYDNRPKHASTTWGALIRRLGNHTVTTDKKGAKLWSPAIYAPGSTRRCNAAVEAITLLVADVDDGTPAEALMNNLGDLDYIVSSTFRYKPEHPRLRVVIRLSEPIPSADYADVWGRANQHLFGGHMDPSTTDASRMYFQPQVQPGIVPISVHHQGHALDWKTLPPLPPAPIRAPKTPATNLAPPTRLDERRAQGLLRKWSADVAQAAHGTRHTTLRNLARSAGGYVASGLLDEVNVRDMLYDGAVASGLVDDDGERNVERTLDDGLRHGALEPLVPDDLGGSRWPPGAYDHSKDKVDGAGVGTHYAVDDNLPGDVVELQALVRSQRAELRQVAVERDRARVERDDLEGKLRVVNGYLDRQGLSYGQRVVGAKLLLNTAWLLDRKPSAPFTPNTERIMRETGASENTVNGTYRVLCAPGGVFERIPGRWPSGNPRVILKATNQSAASAAEVFDPPTDFMTIKPTKATPTQPPCETGHPAARLVVVTQQRQYLVCAEGEPYAESTSTRRREIDVGQAETECNGQTQKLRPEYVYEQTSSVELRSRGRENAILAHGGHDGVGDDVRADGGAQREWWLDPDYLYADDLADLQTEPPGHDAAPRAAASPSHPSQPTQASFSDAIDTANATAHADKSVTSVTRDEPGTPDDLEQLPF